MELSHQQAVIRLQTIHAELERLGGIDPAELTAEDKQNFEELTREFSEVNDHREQLERRASLERVKAASASFGRKPVALGIEPGTARGSDYDDDPILNPDSVEERRFRNPWDLSQVREYGRSREEISGELRSRALCAIEKMNGANDAVRAAATAIIERWDDQNSRIAQLCLATSSPAYLRAFARAASGQQNLMSPEEKHALERAMSLTDSQGGYLVPFQMDPTVIITSDGSLNQIRQAARQVVATGDVWHGVSAGEVSWRWAAEASEAGDNSPTFAQPTVTVHKADGFVPISYEAMQDAANVTAEVGRLLARGKDTLEAEAFITGTGAGQPTGIVTALAGTGSVVTPTTAETFAAADIYKMDTALPARYRANASWLAHRGIYNQIRNFDVNGGAQLWEHIGNGMPAELLGRRALEAEDMASGFDTAVTADNHILIYGDLTNYVIADRIGMTVEFVPQLFGANGRPNGQRGWYAFYRVGADSVNDGGMRVLSVPTTA